MKPFWSVGSEQHFNLFVCKNERNYQSANNQKRTCKPVQKIMLCNLRNWLINKKLDDNMFTLVYNQLLKLQSQNSR